MKRLVILGAGLATLLGLGGCYTVPETGRSAFILPIGNDGAQGAAAFSDIKSKEKISRDPIVNERVNRIGRRIADAVGGDLPGAGSRYKDAVLAYNSLPSVKEVAELARDESAQPAPAVGGR